MSQLAKDIKRTLLAKGILLFLLWYCCIHSVPHQKPQPKQVVEKFFLTTSSEDR